MTKKIKLFTDSAADVPVEYKEKYGIEIVPITVMFGTVEYKDQVTLSLEEFWEKMLSSQELPSTNQANPHDFVEAFQPFLEQGYTILYIGLSSRLSCTLQSAVIARELLQSQDIHIFDSKSASIGETLLLLEAAEMLEEGRSVPEIMDVLAQRREESFAYFTLETLTHLVRGGRLSKAQGLIGSVLNIRPILRIAPDGTIEPTEKARSTKRALQTIVSKAKERNIDFSKRRVAVVHTPGAESLEEFIELVQSELNPAEIITGLIGPTVGTHTGPSGIALFF